MCASRSDTVFDGGIGETVIGCTSVAAATSKAAAVPAAPAASKLNPSLAKAKPLLPWPDLRSATCEPPRFSGRLALPGRDDHHSV